MIKRHFKTAVLLGFLVIICASVYIFFKAFADKPLDAMNGGYSTEVLSAFLGAIITMIITALLLRSQTSMEEEKENRKELFCRKLNIYYDFFEFIGNILEDDKIGEHEIVDLKKWALKLTLVANHKSSLTLSAFISQLVMTKKFRYEDLTGEEKNKIIDLNRDLYKDINIKDSEKAYITVKDVLTSLKMDLGEQIKTDDLSIDVTYRSIDTLINLKNIS